MSRRAAAAAALLAVGAAGATIAGGAQPPRCFGAASRDARHPCHNPRLDRLVTPRPSDAELAPNAPCTPRRGSYPYECVFGVAPGAARATVALVGDSHASHWRAALLPIAQAERWHAVSLTRTGCPLSSATPVLNEPLRSQCIRWKRAIVRWLGAHRDVRTIFVSEHRVRVEHPAGQDPLPTEVAGYRRMWSSLPASVRHVIVIRDTPVDEVGTHRCVQRAIANRQNAGLTCAVPRGVGVKTDPAAVAASGGRSARVGLVDMTSSMCDAAYCYPVVGGVLVHKDIDHITSVFGATTAPYLRRQVDVLLAH